MLQKTFLANSLAGRQRSQGRVPKLAGGTPALPGSLSQTCSPIARPLPLTHELSRATPTFARSEFPALFQTNLPRDDQRRIARAASGLVFTRLPAALGSSRYDSICELSHRRFLARQRLERWTTELALQPESQHAVELRRRIEEHLDAGHGECWLRRSDIARLVEGVLFHFDGQRYRLLA